MLDPKNVFRTSKIPQRSGGSSWFAPASIARSPQIAGIHIRLIQVWNLMHLRTPRPLASVATRSWHSMLVARRMPKTRHAMQTAERGNSYIDTISSSGCPDSGVIWRVPEVIALLSIWIFWIMVSTLTRCIPYNGSPKTGQRKAFRQDTQWGLLYTGLEVSFCCHRHFRFFHFCL